MFARLWLFFHSAQQSRFSQLLMTITSIGLVVLINVSRGLSAPITLEPDHNDVLAARDSGFLQIHCATCQEVLDSVLMAYRLGEDRRVRLPILVNMDGFYLSFTREPVEIPQPEAVARFLPSFQAGEIRFRASAPESQAVAVLGGGPYSYFRYETHLAMLNALSAYDRIAADFADRFGREWPAVEAYHCDDAQIVFLMIGSFATKARAAVDQLRSAGQSVGLLRPRLLRPATESGLARWRAVLVLRRRPAVGHRRRRPRTHVQPRRIVLRRRHRQPFDWSSTRLRRRLGNTLRPMSREMRQNAVARLLTSPECDTFRLKLRLDIRSEIIPLQLWLVGFELGDASLLLQHIGGLRDE